MDVGSLHDTFIAAQERGSEWLIGVSDLHKAKPEVRIETVEFLYVCECRNCGHNLFENDIAYHIFDDRYCHICAIRQSLKDGFFDLLERLS